jgi:uncharacterized membrane protein YdbT with pleckstrin-like domain
MPFPRSFLNDNEEVVLDLHPHWVFMTWPVLGLAATLFLAIYVNIRVGSDLLTFPLIIVVLVALVWFLKRFSQWRTTNFVLTTDRLIIRRGVIRRRGREIPLEHVNDITVVQNLIDRVVGAGDLQIESAGERGGEMFFDCPHPPRVQNEIYRQMDEANARTADLRQGRRDPSPLEQIDQLEDLRRRGVISQAEFDAKKAQLLDRL